MNGPLFPVVHPDKHVKACMFKFIRSFIYHLKKTLVTNIIYHVNIRKKKLADNCMTLLWLSSIDEGDK
jgi:hypothetical protein